MKKIICPECGAVNDAGAISCSSCGSLLTGAKPVKKVKVINPLKETPVQVQQFEQGEKLLAELSPSIGLRKYYTRLAFLSMLSSLVIPIIVSLPQSFALSDSFSYLLSQFLIYAVIAVVAFFFGRRQIGYRFKRTKYFITDRRVILNVWRNGLRVYIYPYEEISALRLVQPSKYFKKHGFASLILMKKKDIRKIKEEVKKTDPLLDPENIRVIKEEERDLEGQTQDVKKIKKIKKTRFKALDTTLADLDITDAQTASTLINQHLIKEETAKPRRFAEPAGSK